MRGRGRESSPMPTNTIGRTDEAAPGFFSVCAPNAAQRPQQRYRAHGVDGARRSSLLFFAAALSALHCAGRLVEPENPTGGAAIFLLTDYLWTFASRASRRVFQSALECFSVFRDCFRESCESVLGVLCESKRVERKRRQVLELMRGHGGRDL